MIQYWYHIIVIVLWSITQIFWCKLQQGEDDEGVCARGAIIFVGYGRLLHRKDEVTSRLKPVAGCGAHSLLISCSNQCFVFIRVRRRGESGDVYIQLLSLIDQNSSGVVSWFGFFSFVMSSHVLLPTSCLRLFSRPFSCASVSYYFITSV